MPKKLSFADVECQRKTLDLRGDFPGRNRNEADGAAVGSAAASLPDHRWRGRTPMGLRTDHDWLSDNSETIHLGFLARGFGQYLLGLDTTFPALFTGAKARAKLAHISHVAVQDRATNLVVGYAFT